MRQAFILHVVKSSIGTTLAFLYFAGLYFLMKKVATELSIRGTFDNQVEVQQVLQLISESEIIPAGHAKWIQFLPALVLVEASVIHLFIHYLYKIDIFLALSEYDHWSLVDALLETTAATIASLIVILCYISWLQDDTYNLKKSYEEKHTIKTTATSVGFQSLMWNGLEKMSSLKHVMLVRFLYTVLVPLLYWVHYTQQN